MPTRRPTIGLLGLLVGLALVGTSRAQAPIQPPSDRFARVAFLVGTWEGRADGQPGNGTSRRTYERALDGRFLRVRNRSTYPAQPKNPKGEVHEDEGYLSLDSARKRLVLRQFHSEGFVNQYVEVPDSPDAPIVFETEAIENIPPGFRARETYTRRGPDSFDETFELAEPSKDFEVYSRTSFTRVGPR